MTPEVSIVPELIETAAKVAFIFAMNLGFFSPILGYIERKQSALMQDRIGANRANMGPFTLGGLPHIMSDIIKLLFKEDFRPAGADKILHFIAPLISLVPVLIAFTVIPFGGTYTLWGHEVNLVIADLDVGMLFILAVGSIATYGAAIGGWASNNNWSLIGGLRVAAQMFSYEVTMGLTLVGIFMVYGSLRLTDIGMAQEDFFRWGIFLQPLGFVLFFTCALAENKRVPFDMPEAESELVAGYFTEYSGLKFAMFWMGEFLEVVTIGAVLTILFFGGWHIPFVSNNMLLELFSFLGDNFSQLAVMLVNVGVFWFKVLSLIFLQMLIRWTLPRFRYDQLMNLGWKIILPLSLANIFITAVVILVLN